MKHNIRKLAGLLTAVMLLLFMAGCSSAVSDKLYAAENSADYNGLYDSAGKVEFTAESSTAASVVQSQKLIRTMTLDVETDDMDSLLAVLDAKVQALGGYVESKYLRNGGTYSGKTYRYADLTVRIPAESLDGFVDHIAGASNVLSHQESTQDVTLSYVATESRITALETEQQRLLELMAQAEDMASLLMIDERLTEVRTELEQVTSQLRLYDNLVDYGTVNLSITEVQVYTVVEEDPTVWQRIGEGFMNSLKNLGEIFTELFVFAVSCVPYLIPFIVIVLVVLVILKLRKKSRKQKPGNQIP